MKAETKQVFMNDDSNIVSGVYCRSLRGVDSNADISFWFFAVLAVVVGVVLRLYMITEQILLDDEWHGLNYTFDNTFFYIFTHFVGAGATCVPMNLYQLFLLKTVGWSELLLKAPSLAAGILGPVVFPVIVKKILNRRATVIFIFLLAISPFLIFYSRFCRAYSMVAFFAFICILSLYLWAAGEGRKYGIIFVISGVLAVYFHLFAIVAVVAPLGFVFAVKLLHKPGRCDGRINVVPGLVSFISAGTGILVLLTVLLLPAFLQSRSMVPARSDRIDMETLMGLASMLSGTANGYMIVLFFGMLVFGLVRLLRQKPLLAGIFVSTAVLYFAALVISCPDSIHSPIVISRYVIPLFPISFLLVAFGAETVFEYFQGAAAIKCRGYGGLSNLMAAVFLILLFFVGPLSQIYAGPNNFTNHSAFQESYEPLSWQQSYTSDIAPGFVMQQKDLSGFYHWLLKQPRGTAVVEYPMDMTDHNNLLYYYQHFHKKRVLAGYITNPDIQGYGVPEGESAAVFDAASIDYPMTGVRDKDRLKFKNMIDVMNIEALERSGADYIVLHKKVRAVAVVPVSETNRAPVYLSSVDLVYMPVIYLDRMYRGIFGLPVFEDQQLTVFQIKGLQAR